MVIRILILFFVTPIFYACKGGNTPANVVSMNYVQDSLFNNDSLRSSLQEKIINSGDTIAYSELSSIYISFPKEFLYYSMVMANDYNYSPAYYDIYWILKTDSKNDNGVNRLANYYLLRACELNNNDALKHAISIYGDKRAIPSSQDFR